MISNTIKVVGANVNNLKDIDVVFPVGSMTMVVGVSGSGKSSLLRDVIALEGNQRLKEFLGISQNHQELPTNQAFVDPLPAILHIGQRAFRASSRTTVATSSGLLQILRRMFLEWSVPISQVSGERVSPPTAECYSDWIWNHCHANITVWAIPLSFVANDGILMAKHLRSLGFNKVIVRSESDTQSLWEKGREICLDSFRPLSTNSRHLVEVLVGDLDLTKKTIKNKQKLLEILRLAFEAGEGHIFVEIHKSDLLDLQGTHAVGLDSKKHWVTPLDQRIYRPANKHLLSFNAPDHESSGACPECRGLGTSGYVDISQLIINPDKSMHEGACALWTSKNYKYINIHHETIEGLRGIDNFDPNVPWRELTDQAQELILYGAGLQLVSDVEIGSGYKIGQPHAYIGLVPAIMKHIEKGTKTAERLSFLVDHGLCKTCNGSRWSYAAQSLSLNGYNIVDLLDMNFFELAEASSKLMTSDEELPQLARNYFNQVYNLSKSFVGVGLSHLNGARGMREVSEGESRRICLATAFDGRHHGLGLLLDEPARGLHDEDILRLTETLEELKGLHTLIINDHRQLLARGVEHFIELGPIGGPEGGRVVYQGEVPQSWWKKVENLQRQRFDIEDTIRNLRIYGACRYNLRNQDIDIPLGKLVCITGVSGSGKSSFVQGVLKPALENPENVDKKGWAKIAGYEHIEQIISLDQSMPPANIRSTVITMLDMAKDIRSYYANTPQAKKLNLQANDFGLNSGLGRCPECLGIGEVEDASQRIICVSCGGLRFQRYILSIYDEKGMNIAEFLDCSIDKIIYKLSPELEKYRELLQSISRLGLGYITLGRRIDTLSGGEIQRLRIARQLSLDKGENTLFLFDEPSSGLHKKDIVKLLESIDYVIDNGRNTVILVEHNLSLVAASDWVIEFGPGSGPNGGLVVAMGSPEKVMNTDTATGRMLKYFCEDKSPPLKKNISCLDISYLVANTNKSRDLSWFRGLLGYSTAPSETLIEEEGSTPIVSFDFTKIQNEKLISYGGVARHLLSLALDKHLDSLAMFSIGEFLDIWCANPSAHLVIHPFLQDIYIWGDNIPDSIVRDRIAYFKKQHYDIYFSNNNLKIRATREDFKCSKNAAREQRTEVLNKTLIAGAGYVELHFQSNCIGTYATRFVDIDRGIVSPISLSTYDFLLEGKRAKCKACAGSGKQVFWDANLIFSDHQSSILDKELLTFPINEALKGIHRNILTPFFKRMIKEKCWPDDYPYSKWTKDDWNLVVYGFWARPSHGSFIKNNRVDPGEVSSWLRWDGLYSYLQQNLERADYHWVQNVLKKTEHSIDCPFCGGLGLQAYTNMLHIGNFSYSEWIHKGTILDIYDWLGGGFPTKRQQCNALRLRDIMEDMINNGFSDALLFKPASKEAYNTLVPSVVRAFTLMPLILEDM